MVAFSDIFLISPKHFSETQMELLAMNCWQEKFGRVIDDNFRVAAEIVVRHPNDFPNGNLPLILCDILISVVKSLQREEPFPARSGDQSPFIVLNEKSVHWKLPLFSMNFFQIAVAVGNSKATRGLWFSPYLDAKTYHADESSGSGPDLLNHPFHLACWLGHVDIVRQFQDHPEALLWEEGSVDVCYVDMEKSPYLVPFQRMAHPQRGTPQELASKAKRIEVLFALLDLTLLAAERETEPSSLALKRAHSVLSEIFSCGLSVEAARNCVGIFNSSHDEDKLRVLMYLFVASDWKPERKDCGLKCFPLMNLIAVALGIPGSTHGRSPSSSVLSTSLSKIISWLTPSQLSFLAESLSNRKGTRYGWLHPHACNTISLDRTNCLGTLVAVVTENQKKMDLKKMCMMTILKDLGGDGRRVQQLSLPDPVKAAFPELLPSLRAREETEAPGNRNYTKVVKEDLFLKNNHSSDSSSEMTSVVI